MEALLDKKTGSSRKLIKRDKYYNNYHFLAPIQFALGGFYKIEWYQGECFVEPFTILHRVFLWYLPNVKKNLAKNSKVFTSTLIPILKAGLKTRLEKLLTVYQTQTKLFENCMYSRLYEFLIKCFSV